MTVRRLQCEWRASGGKSGRGPRLTNGKLVEEGPLDLDSST